MPKPPITFVTIPSNKYGKGRSSKITQISEHHAVGDAKHVIAKAQGPAIFSTTFTIAMDGTIYQLVDENNTPYCDNAWQSNSRAITIEHAGGGSFPYTEEMYNASAALHAYLFEKYGPLNCVRHRDIPEIVADPSKATACSGALDVERIIRQAKEGIYMGFNYNSVPTPEEKTKHYRNRLFREPTPAELANKDVWGKVLDDNVAELGARLKAAQAQPTPGFAAVTEQLFRKV